MIIRKKFWVPEGVRINRMAASEEDVYMRNMRDRAKFFQNVHVWPLSEHLNYNGWLNNFSDGRERTVAAHILDFFTYYPSRMVDKLLRISIGQAGQLLSTKLSGWEHTDLKHRCLYSFIPGESYSATDSGFLFTRKLRDAAGIPEDRIIRFEQIPQALASSHSPTAIIFVDDFVGSGNQCLTAWTKMKFSAWGKTLQEVAARSDHVFVYASLVANKTGYECIKNNCVGLDLSVVHILGSEYNMFSKDCICWGGDNDFFREGVQLILDKSKALGIPFSNGNDVRDVRGYREQGLALAFEHGAPDAIPSFFYWCQNGWTPLIQKRYER